MQWRLLALVGAIPLASCGTWFDCSAEEKIANPLISFANVTSTPDPVVSKGNQTISKTILYKGDTPLPKVTARLEQYWKVFNKTWFKFLSINTDFCGEHAGACPIAPHATVSVTTQHPPLHWGTPFGFYRSKQVYEDENGTKLGCVDMRFDYCKDAQHCKYEDDAPSTDLSPVGESPTPCCQTCEWPRAKYFSVDAPHGFCGEACMLPALFPLFKKFEANLTAAKVSHPCAAQLSPRGQHYTTYNGTVTHGVPGLSITLDLYAPSPHAL